MKYHQQFHTTPLHKILTLISVWLWEHECGRAWRCYAAQYQDGVTCVSLLIPVEGRRDATVWLKIWIIHVNILPSVALYSSYTDASWKAGHLRLWVAKACLSGSYYSYFRPIITYFTWIALVTLCFIFLKAWICYPILWCCVKTSMATKRHIGTRTALIYIFSSWIGHSFCTVREAHIDDKDSPLSWRFAGSLLLLTL